MILRRRRIGPPGNRFPRTSVPCRGNMPMKELRSIVNGLFAFSIFLLAFALLVPGHVKNGRRPHFLRMDVEDLREAKHDRLSLSVPYFFIGNAMRLATGHIHRELELHFDEEIDTEELKGLLDDLKQATEGHEVTREHDDKVLHFRKDGASILLEVAESADTPQAERVRIRFPLRLMEAAVRDGRDFNLEAILSELRSAREGD